ncbi:MAG: hypothetical protein ACRELT_11645, partial [Longimicrobiales bacterium]
MQAANRGREPCDFLRRTQTGVFNRFMQRADTLAGLHDASQQGPAGHFFIVSGNHVVRGDPIPFHSEDLLAAGQDRFAGRGLHAATPA